MFFVKEVMPVLRARKVLSHRLVIAFAACPQKVIEELFPTSGGLTLGFRFGAKVKLSERCD
jgi:hypothetical protein